MHMGISIETRKVLVIGLDCAEPSLLFETWRDELPHLSALMDRGLYGPLTSTVPPITVPAWASMLTSKDPGQLGIYGFRNRTDHSYDRLSLASAASIRAKTVDQILSRNRLTSILLGVPLTYPPRPIRGLMVSGILTPDKSVSYTYPDEFRHELDQAAGGDYIIDVADFRTEDKARLLDEIYRMTASRFQAARHLVRTRPWDFFMMVDMGIDRIHHGFWRFHDPEHRLYKAGGPYEHAIRDYYRAVDRYVGELVELVPPETLIMVVSDHGAKTMIGGFAINQWLIRQGFLTLKDTPVTPARLTPDMVDWPRTRAWGEGGYYGRIFLNVEGRECQGTVRPAEYETTRNAIKVALEAEVDHRGLGMGNVAFRPEDLYRDVTNIPPDLIVYFGNLSWRSVSVVGRGQSLYVFHNDTGPDDANHAQFGVCLMAFKENSILPGGHRPDLSIYDIAPTILDHLGVSIPDDMIGQTIR